MSNYIQDALNFIKNMEKMGFKAKTDFKGNFVFSRVKNPKIRGKKAWYADSHFQLVGTEIICKDTLKRVDESYHA